MKLILLRESGIVDKANKILNYLNVVLFSARPNGKIETDFELIVFH